MQLLLDRNPPHRLDGAGAAAAGASRDEELSRAHQKVLCAVAAAAERARLTNQRRIDDVADALSPHLEDDCVWVDAVRAGAVLLNGLVTRGGILRATHDVEEMTRVLLEEVRMGDALRARRPDAFRAGCRNVLYRIRIPALIAKNLESCLDGSTVKLGDLDPATAEVAACMTDDEWAALRDYRAAKEPVVSRAPETSVSVRRVHPKRGD